ncbi:autotransporter domain-containing protein [Roseibium algae]|uniref:Autotransporter domain-containing protein n=1 Tax=Roseibium algae TaxID=3123038 RepID=A0ABU8TFM0_9HYPH
MGLTIGTELDLASSLAQISKLIMSASAAWLHGFGEGRTPDSSNILHGASWNAYSADAGQDAFEGQLNVEMSFNDSLSAYLTGNYTHSDNAESGRVMGGLSLTW